jgi:hypothetical protein
MQTQGHMINPLLSSVLYLTGDPQSQRQGANPASAVVHFAELARLTHVAPLLAMSTDPTCGPTQPPTLFCSAVLHPSAVFNAHTIVSHDT